MTLIEKLRSQIGDDIQHVFDHEVLFRLAAARIEELEAERDAWMETARLHGTAEAAFLKWLRKAGEHMRDVGVTICDDGIDSGEVLAAKVPECAALLKARIDGLEAENFALAAQQCLFSDGSGLCGDEWGHQYCAMKRRAEAAEAKLATARNDALEEAAIAAEAWYRNLGKGMPHDEVRALKSTNQT